MTFPYFVLCGLVALLCLAGVAYGRRERRRSQGAASRPAGARQEGTGLTMGYIPQPTPEMGEYNVEVRRESFYLRGEDSYDGEARHAFHLYSNPCGQGTVEVLIEDIPKIHAALDLVERVAKGERGL